MVLVVGINPSSSQRAGKSVTIKRLHKWTDELGIGYFSFTNVVSFPGKFTEADVDYESLESICKKYDKVIALGNFPSKVLAKIGINHFMLPHPSGLNRKLNDRNYELKVLGECNEYLKT